MSITVNRGHRCQTRLIEIAIRAPRYCVDLCIDVYTTNPVSYRDEATHESLTHYTKVTITQTF